MVLPLAALAVYDRIGAPGLVVFDAAAPRGEVSAERVDKAISELEARVRAKPDDAEGWAMLGQAKRFRDDAAGAAQAYGKAVALVPRDAGLLADYAEALALLHDGNFAGKPMDLLGQAMAIAPKDGKVLCFFQSAGKFKTRYATFGFSDQAALDDGGLWPTSFAIHRFGDAEAATLAALVRRAVG